VRASAAPILPESLHHDSYWLVLDIAAGVKLNSLREKMSENA